MKIPDIFGAERPIADSGGRKSFSEDSLAGGGSAQIQLNIPRQQRSLWCWVAVGSGIADYYHPAVPSQCKVASGVLGLADGFCCSPSGAACNRLGYLNHTLDYFGCFDRYEEGAASAEHVLHEIAEKRPIGVRVQWQSGPAKGVGHFVAISAIRQSPFGTTLVVKDPAEGTTAVVPKAIFSASYGPALGRWTHSFFTISPAQKALSGGADHAGGRDDDLSLLGGC